jgi:hypothetical protein
MLPTHASHVLGSFAPVTHGSCAHDPTTYAPRASVVDAISLGTSSRLPSDAHDAAAAAIRNTAKRAYIGHLHSRRPDIAAYTWFMTPTRLIFIFLYAYNGLHMILPYTVINYR